MPVQRVLVIDDDEVSNMLLSCLMEDVCSTCSISFKKNGKEALAYLKLQSEKSDQFPDLIILDFNQPDMDASDFVKAYEANFTVRFPHTMIINLTCHALEKDRQAILQFSSVVAFFNKPLEERQLLQVMKERVNKP